MQVGDESYRKTLRRWNTLTWLDNPTARQRAECEQLGAELDAAELAHSRRSVFETVAEDYKDLGETGHLGGVELT